MGFAVRRNSRIPRSPLQRARARSRSRPDSQERQNRLERRHRFANKSSVRPAKTSLVVAPGSAATPQPAQATRLPAQRLQRPKVGMISLGCAKNLVDAEIMLGSVLERGMEIPSSADDADVLVINTCAFIDSAKEESIDAILEAHQQRGLYKRAKQRLIVSGCMSQRFSDELREQLPEVDAFIGLDQVRELGTIVERVLQQRPTLNAQRSRSNAESWAL